MATQGGNAVRKKIALMALTALIIPSALASYQVTEVTGDEEIAAGDALNFKLNTTEEANYTADLIDSSGDVVFSNSELPFLKNQSVQNETHYIYGFNYTLSEDARVGSWKSSAYNGFSQVSEYRFEVVAQELRIVETESFPFFKNTDDNVIIQTNVTNAEEEVDSISLTVSNTSIQDSEMQKVQSTDAIDTYQYNTGELGQGSYSYDVNLQGSEGTQKSVSKNFEVYSSNRDADHSDINVGIASLCGTSVTQFRPPGGGILPTGREGSFLLSFTNNASSTSNVTASLNVTFQNETEWSPEDGLEEIGNQTNKTYEAMNETDLTPASSFSAARTFPKTNQTGYYLGRLKVNTECRITDGAIQDPIVYGTQTANTTDYVNFRVLVAGGDTGGSGEPIEEPIPRDANQTGEESNETVEGDNDNPGQTPVPEPEPVPEPVPDPIPALSLNIEAVNSSVSTPRGGFQEVELRLENLANASIENLTISPQISNLPGDWASQQASVSELSPNETAKRSIFLNPSQNVRPGTYRVSIYGGNGERLLDVERIDFTVFENTTESSIRISEAPEVVRISSGESQTIPLLVENLGEEAVENSTLTVQNLEDCGEASGSYSTSIQPNSSESISLNITSVSELRECDATIIVSTPEGSYSFADMRVEVVPDEGFVPPELRFPIFATAWTVLLILYSVVMTRYNLNSLRLKIPYLVLIVVEAVIFLYIATEFYGIIPPELLPF
ncbi:MAG: hypothetical protein ACI83Q_000577 [Colwellia polaris]|jgi:hypothetical protein